MRQEALFFQISTLEFFIFSAHNFNRGLDFFSNVLVSYWTKFFNSNICSFCHNSLS